MITTGYWMDGGWSPTRFARMGLLYSAGCWARVAGPAGRVMDGPSLSLSLARMRGGGNGGMVPGARPGARFYLPPGQQRLSFLLLPRFSSSSSSSRFGDYGSRKIDS